MLLNLIKVQEEIHVNMKGIHDPKKPLKIFKFLKILKIPSLPEGETTIISKTLVMKVPMSKHHPSHIITLAN